MKYDDEKGRDDGEQRRGEAEVGTQAPDDPPLIEKTFPLRMIFNSCVRGLRGRLAARRLFSGRGLSPSFGRGLSPGW